MEKEEKEMKEETKGAWSCNCAGVCLWRSLRSFGELCWPLLVHWIYSFVSSVFAFAQFLGSWFEYVGRRWERRGEE